MNYQTAYEDLKERMTNLQFLLAARGIGLHDCCDRSYTDASEQIERTIEQHEEGIALGRFSG